MRDVDIVFHGTNAVERSRAASFASGFRFASGLFSSRRLMKRRDSL